MARGATREIEPEFIGKAMTGVRRELVTAFNELITDVGVFKVIVPKDGRLTIPEAERVALGIKPGDVLQVFVKTRIKHREK